MAQLKKMNAQGYQEDDQSQPPNMGDSGTPDWARSMGVDWEKTMANPIMARSGETPRDREGSMGFGASATPAQPRQPTPHQAAISTDQGGSSEGAMPAPPTLRPFQPMGSPSVGSMATPKMGGLFGSLGGLKGGGLGVPLDPSPNEQGTDLITKLLSMIGK